LGEGSVLMLARSWVEAWAHVMAFQLVTWFQIRVVLLLV
jgi:hypothetical protein